MIHTALALAALWAQRPNPGQGNRPKSPNEGSVMRNPGNNWEPVVAASANCFHLARDSYRRDYAILLRSMGAVRVIQSDKNMAWASPIWVRRK